MALPSARDYLRQLKDLSQKAEGVEYRELTELVYDTGELKLRYPFVWLAPASISIADRLVIIRAGIHGDEIAGPMTILRHLAELHQLATASSVKLVIFPLDNPSGFDAKSRYNILNDRGHEGNNDFLRYRLKFGEIKGELEAGQEMHSWLWSSDPALGLTLPSETVALHSALRMLPLSQVVALVDLHQDNFIGEVGAYHYIFRDEANKDFYEQVAAQVAKHLPLLANREIGSGQASSLRSDKFGAIHRHDGTLSDLFYRLGTKISITVETTGVTPLEIADRVNMIWLKNVIEYMGTKRSAVC